MNKKDYVVPNRNILKNCIVITIKIKVYAINQEKQRRANKT